MLTPRTALARRVTAALDASPSRIPVLLGGCGSGRTTLVQQVRERLGRGAVHAIGAVSPFPVADTSTSGPAGARAAFDAALAFFSHARTAASEPATFLLDE